MKIHQPARLILIRHGESEWNVEARYQGQLDSALTATGRSQARALATRLAQHRLAALYSSDLGRAEETARICGDACGLQPILDARLRERHLGIFQGLLKSEIRLKFAEEYRRFKNDLDYALPDGESARQSSARMMACLNDLAARHGGQEIAVIAHGGTTSALLRHTLGIPLAAPRRFERRNGSWNVFVFDDGKWFLETWGDFSHLESSGGSQL